MQKLTKNEIQVHRNYHPPSCSNYQSVKVNVVHLNMHNDYEHELAKFKECWNIRKGGQSFITEAERNRKRGEERKIVDIVNLSNGDEIEIIFKHESDSQIKAYRDQGVIPIVVNGMQCSMCQKTYPKRNEKGVCQLCK